MPPFRLDSIFTPTADQPEAIADIAAVVRDGARFTTLLGATGTGKTMTMAGVIEAVQRPTLLIAHNKTLAAQLCNEFRTYFPDNAVEYFVSYYDYSTSRRTRPSTRRSTACATPPPLPSSPAVTWWSSPRCRRSSAWAPPRSMR